MDNDGVLLKDDPIRNGIPGSLLNITVTGTHRFMVLFIQFTVSLVGLEENISEIKVSQYTPVQ